MMVRHSNGSSVETPVACADLAAGRAAAGEALSAAPAGFGEVAADLIAAAEFAHRGEGSVIAAIVPLVGTADVAVQAVGIDPECRRLVVAIHVAADDIAEQATNHDAADGGAGPAMTGEAADQSTRECAEDGAVDRIAAVATLFIGTLLVIAGRRGRRGTIARRGWRRRTIVIAVTVTDAAIAAVVVVIAVVIGLAVITIRIVARRHPAGLGPGRSPGQRRGRAGRD